VPIAIGDYDEDEDEDIAQSDSSDESNQTIDIGSTTKSSMIMREDDDSDLEFPLSQTVSRANGLQNAPYLSISLDVSSSKGQEQEENIGYQKSTSEREMTLHCRV